MQKQGRPEMTNGGTKGNISHAKVELLKRGPQPAEPREMMSRARLKKKSSKCKAKATIPEKSKGDGDGEVEEKAKAKKRRAPRLKAQGILDEEKKKSIEKDENVPVAMEVAAAEESRAEGDLLDIGMVAEEPQESEEEEEEEEVLEPIVNIAGSLPLGPTLLNTGDDVMTTLEATRHGMLPPIHLLVQDAPCGTHPPTYNSYPNLAGQATGRGINSPGPQSVANPSPPSKGDADRRGRPRRSRGTVQADFIRQKHGDRDAGNIRRQEKQIVVASWINGLTEEI